MKIRIGKKRQRVYSEPSPPGLLDLSESLSPGLLAVALLIFGILCTLVSVYHYEMLIGERNLMHGNITLYSYLGLCTLIFLVASTGGYWLHQRLRRKRPRWITKVETRRYSVVTAIVWTLIGLNVLLSLIRLAYLNSVIGLGSILAAFGGGGSHIRDQIIDVLASGNVGWISDVTLGLTSAVLWLATQTRGRWRKKFMRLAYLNLLFFVAASLVTLSRDIMLTGVLIAVLLQIATVPNKGALGRLRILGIAILGIGVFAAMFVLVAQSRSSGGQDTLARQFMGYFPASYNRLAALLNGSLVFPNSNWGFYSTQWFWDFPVLTNIFNFYALGRGVGLDIPLSNLDNWNAQFLAVQYAGFNRSYIWTTAYGFAYSDFGWWGSLVFAVYGLIAGWLYRSFRQGSALGGLIYPYLVTTIIKWWSILYISSRTTDVMFIIYGVLLVVTWFFNQLRANRSSVHATY